MVLDIHINIKPENLHPTPLTSVNCSNSLGKDSVTSYSCSKSSIVSVSKCPNIFVKYLNRLKIFLRTGYPTFTKRLLLYCTSNTKLYFLISSIYFHFTSFPIDAPRGPQWLLFWNADKWNFQNDLTAINAIFLVLWIVDCDFTVA